MKKLIILAALFAPAYIAISGGDGNYAPIPMTAPPAEALEIDIRVEKDGEIDLDLENLTPHELNHVVEVLKRHRPLEVELTLPKELEKEFENAGWIGPDGGIVDSPLLPVVDILARNGIAWEEVEVD